LKVELKLATTETSVVSNIWKCGTIKYEMRNGHID